MADLIKFYAARLRKASFQELLHRIRTKLIGWRVKKSVSKGKTPFVVVPCLTRNFVDDLNLPKFIGSTNKEMVKEILGGALFYNCFDKETLKNWENALDLDVKRVISLELPKADIRAVWEPARLQHITTLLVYLLQQPNDAESREIEEFARQELMGWLQKNPFLKGLHYRSAMECGLRIPVFFYSIKILKNLSDQEFKYLSDAIFAHAWWMQRNLSLYSSLGNHTVCEASGLVFAGIIFGSSKEGKQWLKSGLELLQQELGHQILNDGGPIEQSFAYHRFVLDIYWLTLDFLALNSSYDCLDMKPRLIAGENFLASVSDTYSKFPSVGDSDDGYAIAPGLFPQRIKPCSATDRISTFPNAGYTVLRDENELRLLFDHGSLGMPPLYNHGHADALSIILSINGTDLLIDPGTYRYNGVTDFRKYFKGTSSHNTVVIDGCDQAVQVTGFVWDKAYSSKLDKSFVEEGKIILEAEHEGYRQINGSIIHRRKLSFTPNESLFVKDKFNGTGEHDFTIHFHIHPDSSITKEDDEWLIQRDGNSISIKLLDGEFELVKGQMNPPIGWYSPGYGQLISSPTLRSHRKGLCNTTSFRTLIRFKRFYSIGSKRGKG